MSFNGKKALLGGVCVAAAVVGGLYFTQSKPQPKPQQGPTVQKAEKPKAGQKAKRKINRPALRKVSKDEKIPLQLEEMPPLVRNIEDLTAEEEALLTAKEKMIYLELRELVNIIPPTKESRRKIHDLVASLSPSKTAEPLRRAAIQAAAWAGGPAAAENLVGYLADANDDLASLASDFFAYSFNDLSLGDRQRVEICVNAAKALEDVDTLRWIFSGFDNARHSVAISGLVDVSQNGTEAAQSLVIESIRNYTGDPDISTVQDAEAWLKNNPDAETDEMMYGPTPDNGGMAGTFERFGSGFGEKRK